MRNKPQDKKSLSVYQKNTGYIGIRCKSCKGFSQDILINDLPSLKLVNFFVYLMILLSIDPGIGRMGYAVLHVNQKNKNFTLRNSGLIESGSKERKEIRIHKIFLHITRLIRDYKVNHIVFEQLFFSHNQKTVQAVYQAQGLLYLIAAQKKISISLLQPLQIKQIITGYGKADKKSVQKMLYIQYPYTKNITQDDQLDAIACGISYCLLNR